MNRFNSEDLYERLLEFGIKSQTLVKKLPKTDYNKIYGLQLLRSSSSPGANYIEALEALSRKDFIHRLKISRKESRESIHWLRLIKYSNLELKDIQTNCNDQIDEGRQLIKIFTSSIITSEKKIS